MKNQKIKLPKIFIFYFLYFAHPIFFNFLDFKISIQPGFTLMDIRKSGFKLTRTLMIRKISFQFKPKKQLN